MLNWFKNRFLSLIDKRIDSVINEVITINNNKYGINFSDDTSLIYMPHSLNGGKYINIGTGSRIGKFCWIGAFDNYLNQIFVPKIIIGNNVNIGNFACITAINRVEISDGCLFSEYVYISDHSHGYDAADNTSPTIQPLQSKGAVIIGENTFIGMRVSVLPGVTIGRNCVVGAHSVVTKSIPDYSMVAGAPAVIVKQYDFVNNQWASIEKIKTNQK